jgi:prevent-host-death family protein
VPVTQSPAKSDDACARPMAARKAALSMLNRASGSSPVGSVHALRGVRLGWRGEHRRLSEGERRAVVRPDEAVVAAPRRAALGLGALGGVPVPAVDGDTAALPRQRMPDRHSSGPCSRLSSTDVTPALWRQSESLTGRRLAERSCTGRYSDVRFGDMSFLSVSEARATLPAILTRVDAGEEVTITRHGRPVAVIVRPDALRVRRAQSALSAAHQVRDLVATARGAARPEGEGVSAARADELVADVRSGRERP